MRNINKKIVKRTAFFLVLILLLAVNLSGCGDGAGTGTQNGLTDSVSSSDNSGSSAGENTNGENAGEVENSNADESDNTGSDESAENGEASGGTGDAGQISVTFGENGSPFILQLENNETAEAIAALAGSKTQNLQILHFDDFENCDRLQYYDIAGDVSIPAKPESFSSEKIGEVYFCEPNRIILFYKNASIEGDYVKIGKITDTSNLVSAVEENQPVADGYKVVSVRAAAN